MKRGIIRLADHLPRIRDFNQIDDPGRVTIECLDTQGQRESHEAEPSFLGTKISGLGENPTLSVDYVFAGPRFEAIDPGIARDETVQNHVEVNDQTRISDHFPLIIDVPISLERP